MVEEKLCPKFDYASPPDETSMKYWRLVSLDSPKNDKTQERNCKIQEIPEAKAFFTREFPAPDLKDVKIQRQLIDWFREEPSNGNSTRSNLAELCLRCFISSQIESSCIEIEQKFGTTHGFTRYDLFPFVLYNPIPNHPNESNDYIPFTTQVLQQFNPGKSNLSTWTKRLVSQHQEIKTFLLEHGVYIVSDWAILNDTTPKQIQRILLEFHLPNLTEFEIQAAVKLLTSYHAIYRQQRFAERKKQKEQKARITWQCSPPTDEQLLEIAKRLKLRGDDREICEEVTNQLQNLASQLRQYRIAVRRKTVPTENIYDPNTALEVDKKLAENFTETTDEDNGTSEFLEFYHQQLIDSLDTALKQITQSRLTNLERKKPADVSKFIIALHLHHCQQESMSAIAPKVELKAQYQVTRLLKLTDFRADVRQEMLKLLLTTIPEKAKTYASPERLSTLSEQVESALNEQIAEMIQLAEAESSNPKKTCTAKSLFSERLCLYLTQLAPQN